MAGFGVAGQHRRIEPGMRGVRMILACVNKVKQVLCVTYVGKIRPVDLKQGREEFKSLLPDLRPGFRLLVNLSHLDQMGIECRTEIGRNMELLSQSGVARVVYIIPDPNKDLGMNILAFFHYRNHPQIMNCATLTEGIEKLLA